MQTEDTSETRRVSALMRAAVPVGLTNLGYDDLVLEAGRSRLVLLGEATHGSHEFYAARAHLTRRLILEHGFSAVAVEADWPDAYRVNQFVRELGTDRSATEALSGFVRFPTWMWRNTDVALFVDWLYRHNLRLDRAERVGFYGLDLYSLQRSMQHVVDYLERVDKPAAERARQRYSCFGDFDLDPQAYGYEASLNLEASCEEQVVRTLIEVRDKSEEYLRARDQEARDQLFCAERNAVVASNAERYYRELYKGDVSSWNLRDRHMFETLEALAEHLQQAGRPPKIVVWAHNSHIGDARATAMARRKELNLGQLVREHHHEAAYLVGFTTYTGYVSAAERWGGRMQHKRVLPARKGSYEWLFHQIAERMQSTTFWLPHRFDGVRTLLRGPLLERAIGVVYRPQTEFWSHYYESDLGEEFDATVHVDRTHAVESLEPVPSLRTDTIDTYPSGL